MRGAIGAWIGRSMQESLGLGVCVIAYRWLINVGCEGPTLLSPSCPAGKATPIFSFVDGRCEVMLTLDLKEGTLRFTHAGRSIGTIAAVKGPLHAAVTVTTSKQTVGWEQRGREVLGPLGWGGYGCRVSGSVQYEPVGTWPV